MVEPFRSFFRESLGGRVPARSLKKPGVRALRRRVLSRGRRGTPPDAIQLQRPQRPRVARRTGREQSTQTVTRPALPRCSSGTPELGREPVRVSPRLGKTARVLEFLTLPGEMLGIVVPHRFLERRTRFVNAELGLLLGAEGVG